MANVIEQQLHYINRYICINVLPKFALLNNMQASKSFTIPTDKYFILHKILMHTRNNKVITNRH